MTLRRELSRIAPALSVAVFLCVVDAASAAPQQRSVRSDDPSEVRTAETPNATVMDELRQMRRLVENQSEQIQRLESEVQELRQQQPSPSLGESGKGPTGLNQRQAVGGTAVWGRDAPARFAGDAATSTATRRATLGPLEPLPDVPEAPELLTEIANTSDQDKSSGPRFGYDKGFFISSPEGIKIGDLEVPFLLKLRARLDFRYSIFDSHGPTPDEQDFELERARLYFLGHFLWPYFEYDIVLDADEDDTREAESTGVYHWIYSYKFSEPLGWECAEMGFRFGKWKSPLFRQETESSAKQQFVERSMANEFFNIDRNTGVSLYGKFDLLSRPFQWEVAAINGFNTTTSRPSRLVTPQGVAAAMPEDLDDHLAVVSKTSWGLIGEWGEDGEPDLSYHCCPALRVGTSLGFTRMETPPGAIETREMRQVIVTDTGARLTDILPDTVTEFSQLLYGIDWGYKYRGWSLNNEFFFRNTFDFVGADVDDLFDWGYYAQLGYFLVPSKLEVAGRYSTVIGDSGTLGGSNHSGDEVAGTINWYIRGHSLKFQFDVSHYNGAVLSSSAGNFRAGDVGWLFRSQIQVFY